MRCATWKYREWFVNFCYCSVKSCLFAQCWPGIFLVQCWWNLCNVGAEFVAAGYYQKVNQSKINAPATIQWAFPVQCCLESLSQYCTGSYLCNVVPRATRQHCYPKSIKATGFFPVQCCLERFGQHCLRFLPVQCCPKRIKTTLKRIFSCPKSIKTTLKNNFSCAMMSESLGKRYTRYLFTYAKLAHV